MTDHQLGELVAIYQNNPLTEKIRRLSRRRRESRSRHEESFCGFVTVEAPKKISDCTRTNLIARSVPLGLNINSIQPKDVLINNPINSVVAAAAKRATRIDGR